MQSCRLGLAAGQTDQQKMIWGFRRQLNMREQCALAADRTNGILSCVIQIVGSMCRKMILPLCPI